MKRQIFIIVGALILSVFLGYSLNINSSNKAVSTFEQIDVSKALIKQEIETVNTQPVEIIHLFRSGQLIGVVHDKKTFDSLLDEVYEQQFKSEFANSRVGFVDDIYEVKSLSYNTYEDKDKEIFEYIKSENLFAVEANRIEFTNGAIIYVKNIEDFTRARETFVRNFVSTEESYKLLVSNEAIPEMIGYGEREIALDVKESFTATKGFATYDQILKDESSIQLFLSYGYEPEIQTYTVQQFDSVDGIAWNNGLTGVQLITVNREKLKSRDQILEEGMSLNVSKFNSPLTVQVTKERKVQEIIYPEEPIYQEDPELKEGLEVVDVLAENGLRDVTYNDISINTESLVSSEVASKTVKEPVRSVVRYGTKIEPKVGSGNFRWPISNGYISCGYGDICYTNHNGTDFVYYGNGGLGPIYASDRGVVVANTYASDWGNYIHIDHGNGYATRYAHMATPGYVFPGDIVAPGDEIGYIGSTGRVTGPHLHFEIYYNGSRINPCSMLGC